MDLAMDGMSDGGASSMWSGESAPGGGSRRQRQYGADEPFSALAVGGEPPYEVTISQDAINVVFLASAVRERRLPVPSRLRPLFVKGRVYLRTADGYYALRSVRTLVGFLAQSSQRYEYIGQSALVRFAAVRGHTLRGPDKHVLYSFVDPVTGSRVTEHLLAARREVARWKDLLGVRRGKNARRMFQ